MEGSRSAGNPTQAPVIGLIALDRDVVIEDDLHELLRGAASLITTRIPLAQVGSITALAELGDQLPRAAHLLLSASPATVAFGCTSGVAVIGAKEVRLRVQETLAGVSVVDPLSMISSGLRELGAKSVSLVTPYGPEVSGILSIWLRNQGFRVVADLRIDHAGADHYAEIPAASIEKAVRQAAVRDTQAIVVACTDLRVLDLIEELEESTGVPVLSSNQALARAASLASGVEVPGPGRLFKV